MTTDDPDYINRELARVLTRISEDPGDVRRLLKGLATAPELVSKRIPPEKEGDKVLLWRNESEDA